MGNKLVPTVCQALAASCSPQIRWSPLLHIGRVPRPGGTWPSPTTRARPGGGGVLGTIPSLHFSTGPEHPRSFQCSRGSRQTHLQPYVSLLGTAFCSKMPSTAGREGEGREVEGGWQRGGGGGACPAPTPRQGGCCSHSIPTANQWEGGPSPVQTQTLMEKEEGLSRGTADTRTQWIPAITIIVAVITATSSSLVELIT